MVVLLDLDEDLSDPYVDSRHGTGFPPARLHGSRSTKIKSLPSGASFTGDERANPNLNGFSAALSCYPYVSRARAPIQYGKLANRLV